MIARLSLALALASCAPGPLPEGVLACDSHADCPPGFFCRVSGRCYSQSEGCEPRETDVFGYTLCAGSMSSGIEGCEDVRGMGRSLGLADDGIGEHALPFTFQWYDAEIQNIGIAANGLIFFGELPDTTAANSCSTPVDSIAAYWDDLLPTDVRVAAFGDHVTVQWIAGYYMRAGSVDIRTSIFEDGHAVTCYVDVSDGSANSAYAASATIGFAGPEGYRLEYSCNQTFVNDGLVVGILAP